jgi:hypothetical protein
LGFLTAVRTLAKTIHYNSQMQVACMPGAVHLDLEILWHRLLSEMKLTCNTFKQERAKQSVKQVVKTVMLPKNKAF